MSGADGPVWQQMTYATAASVPGAAGGGWGVLQRSPGLSASQEELLSTMTTTLMESHPALPPLPSDAQLATRSRRLRCLVKGQDVILNHVVEAGADSAGRPGNAFNHMAIRAIDGQYPAISTWGSADWRVPYGQQAVAAVTLAPDITPGVLNRDSTLAWIGSDDIDLALPWMLDAAQSCWSSGRALVIAVGSAAEAASWIAAITLLTAYDSVARAGWSTFESGDSLRVAVRDGLAFVGVHRDQTPSNSRDLGDALYVDPRWELDPGPDGSWLLPSGDRLQSTPLSTITLDLLTLGVSRTAEVLRRCDELVHEIAPQQRLPLYWGPALATLEAGIASFDRRGLILMLLRDCPITAHVSVQHLYDEVQESLTAPELQTLSDSGFLPIRVQVQRNKLREWISAGAKGDLPTLDESIRHQLVDDLRPQFDGLVDTQLIQLRTGGDQARNAILALDRLASQGLLPTPQRDTDVPAMERISDVLKVLLTQYPRVFDEVTLTALQPLVTAATPRPSARSPLAVQTTGWERPVQTRVLPVRFDEPIRTQHPMDLAVGRTPASAEGSALQRVELGGQPAGNVLRQARVMSGHYVDVSRIGGDLIGVAAIYLCSPEAMKADKIRQALAAVKVLKLLNSQLPSRADLRQRLCTRWAREMVQTEVAGDVDGLPSARELAALLEPSELVLPVVAWYLTMNRRALPDLVEYLGQASREGTKVTFLGLQVRTPGGSAMLGQVLLEMIVAISNREALTGLQPGGAHVGDRALFDILNGDDPSWRFTT